MLSDRIKGMGFGEWNWRKEHCHGLPVPLGDPPEHLSNRKD